MENWGCVTWGDGVLLRGTPTYDQRRCDRLILLHEMAHMWFGDLVTMKWWNDLWLNEAFASWAATWASVGATSYTDSWAGFLADRQARGLPRRHGPGQPPDPRRRPRRLAGDGQLRRDLLPEGPGGAPPAQRVRRRRRVRRRPAAATSATTPGATPGWRTSPAPWAPPAARTSPAGSSTGSTGPAPTPSPSTAPRAAARPRPDGEAPRVPPPRHRLLRRRGRHPAPRRRRRGPHHRRRADRGRPARVRPAPGQRPRPDLRRRPTRPRLAGAAAPPRRATSRTPCLARSPSPPPTTCSSRASSTPRTPSPASSACWRPRPRSAWPSRSCAWPASSPAVHARRPVLAARPGSPTAPRVLAGNPDLRAGALQSLAANAVTAEHFAQLDEAATDDFALAWRVQATRAARGTYDADAVERLLERDPDPDAAANALIVRASRNLPEAKEEAWHALYVEQSVPGGPSMGQMVKRLLATRAARGAAAVHLPLPRGDPLAGRRRHARVFGLIARHVPRGRHPGLPRPGPRPWPAPRAPTRPFGPPCSVASTRSSRELRARGELD